MAYWTVAQLQPRHEVLALRCLALAGYATYVPKLREIRIVRHRKEVTPWLFPLYAFVELVEMRWWEARYAPGVVRLIMAGQQPAAVPPKVLAEIKSRERNGLIELPRRGLQLGDA